MRSTKKSAVARPRIAKGHLVLAGSKAAIRASLTRNLENIINPLEIEKINNANLMLQKGVPVYNSVPGLSKGEMLKTYPSGLREVVTYDKQYKEVYVRAY